MLLCSSGVEIEVSPYKRDEIVWLYRKDGMPQREKSTIKQYMAKKAGIHTKREG